MEDQDLVVDRFSLQGCILSSALQGQAAGGQALSVRDLHGHARFITGVSGEGGKIYSLALKVQNWKVLLFVTNCA